MIPDPAVRPKPAEIVLPVLSADAVAKMTTFWTAFQQLPDSLFTAVMPNGTLAQRQEQRHAFVTQHMTVSPTSVQGKNLAFVTQYHDELNALAATQIWSTP